MLNGLPTIIDGPGEYRTRDGRRVTIHEVRKTSNLVEFPGVTTFAAKGTLYTPLRTHGRTRETFDIWHVSGRRLPLDETSADVVRRDDA